MEVLRIRDVYPGPRIRLFFTYWIPDLGLTRSRIRIRINFNPKTETKFSKISFGMFIPDPKSEKKISIPDRGAKKHWILDPDPQYWIVVNFVYGWESVTHNEYEFLVSWIRSFLFQHDMQIYDTVLLRFSGGVRWAGLLQEDLPQVQAVRLRVPVDPGQGAGPHHQARTACTTLHTFTALIFYMLRNWICTDLQNCAGSLSRFTDPEADLSDIIGTKVLRVFLLAFHSHLY